MSSLSGEVPILSLVVSLLHLFPTKKPNKNVITSNINRAKLLEIEATTITVEDGPPLGTAVVTSSVGVGTGIYSLLMKGEGEGVMERDCEDSEGECDLLLLLEICAGMTCKSILSLRVVAITVTLHV